MAESRSQFEPEPKTPPSSLGQILDLLVSVGYAEAGKPDISASEKLAGGLAWCIAAVNDVVRDGTLRSGEQIEVEKRVEGGLKLIGCPHPLETSQIKNLDCKAIFPVVQWLVNRIPTVQDHNGDDEKTLQQRFGDDVGQLLDPNHPSILKSAAATGQPSGQVLHGTAGGMPLQVQARNQQLPGSTADIKTEINPVLNTRAAGPEGSLMGIPGFTLTAVNSVKASNRKIVSCHFSSDGKLLASGGLDKKAVLWFTDTLTAKSMLEEHSSIITDVRFSPNMSRLATSSFDKTVRVWDVENPGYSLRTFTGHSGAVMSLDFHPNKDDLICSCDGDGEIRYWSIKNGSCARMFKGGTTQMRFQPRHGKYLAAAAEYVVSILDVETLACRHSLQGHTKTIHSVCWNSSGDFLASVSEDSVRVWRLGSGSEGECVHELSCNGNKFHSCVFHPTYPSLLVIACYQSLELWNMSENKTMTLSAHEGLIAGLAVSTVTGLVASASHDKCVKLWK